MLKYVDAKVVMAEVPNELTLAISISNCTRHCKGCHSSYLREDIGKPLTSFELLKLIRHNLGITCVCFMGEGNSPDSITHLSEIIKDEFPELKVAYYTGYNSLHPAISLKHLDYVKVGEYDKDLGGLNSRRTNQVMYKLIHKPDGSIEHQNITSKFLKI